MSHPQIRSRNAFGHEELAATGESTEKLLMAATSDFLPINHLLFLSLSIIFFLFLFQEPHPAVRLSSPIFYGSLSCCGPLSWDSQYYTSCFHLTWLVVTSHRRRLYAGHSLPNCSCSWVCWEKGPPSFPPRHWWNTPCARLSSLLASVISYTITKAHHPNIPDKELETAS